MKRLGFFLLAVIVLTGCGNHKNNHRTVAEAEMIENGKIGYADIVSYIVQGFQCQWEGMSPEELGLSPVYAYQSEYAGFAIKDINGDGIDELLLGDQFEDGNYFLYDIYSIRPSDGSLVHLAKGGERDRFTINGSGIIVENASDSAEDSFCKGFAIKNLELKEVKSWEESMMMVELEKFALLADKTRMVGAFGEQREINDEEMEMFRKATAADSLMVYTPLSVSTQVVAGINYRFWCRYEDLSDGIQRKAADGADKYGYCWIKIFKPLPSRGEPQVTSIDKDGELK